MKAKVVCVILGVALGILGSITALLLLKPLAAENRQSAEEPLAETKPGSLNVSLATIENVQERLVKRFAVSDRAVGDCFMRLARAEIAPISLELLRSDERGGALFRVQPGMYRIYVANEESSKYVPDDFANPVVVEVRESDHHTHLKRFVKRVETFNLSGSVVCAQTGEGIGPGRLLVRKERFSPDEIEVTVEEHGSFTVETGQRQSFLYVVVAGFEGYGDFVGKVPVTDAGSVSVRLNPLGSITGRVEFTGVPEAHLYAKPYVLLPDGTYVWASIYKEWSFNMPRLPLGKYEVNAKILRGYVLREIPVVDLDKPGASAEILLQVVPIE